MVINKYVIFEIVETRYRENTEVDFSIDFNCKHGFNTYSEAERKMNALIELKKDDSDFIKSQYKIIQIPFNSAFSTPKKTA